MRKAQNLTAILIIIDSHETVLNQFTTGKPLKSLKRTLEYYQNGSMTLLTGVGAAVGAGVEGAGVGNCYQI
jgi:hypothetical protein